MPHHSRLNRRVTVVDVIAKVHGNRDVLLQHGLEVLAVRAWGPAGFNGDNGGNMVGVAGCRPAGAAALRVSHQNGVLACTLIYLVNGGSHGLCHGLVIKIAAHIRGHAGVRRHLAEELIHGSGIVGELRAFVDNRLAILPAANAELGVPALIQRLGADVTADGGSACFAAAGLVNEEYAVTLAKKHLRPPLTAVRRGHPAHAGLAIAVEEHHGKPGFLCGDLIEHIGVIHMGGLTGSGLLPLVLRVKGSVGGHGNAARRENALL